ncbi:MAG TPA: MOSC domain-containing protein [Tepidisphaeraceae bacterium]|jgi:MOSC domain-containing protein YiiM
MSSHVYQINVNPAGGVPKYAVAETRVEVDHVAGDKQVHLKFHGGTMRAVCLYALERIEALRDEGHPITPGSTGENLTVAGLDWSTIKPGVRLRVGDAVELQITSYAAPCNQIAGSFEGCTSDRISQKLFPGWARVYAKVNATGLVRTGDAVVVL